LFLSGVAMAISHSASFAQDAYLRGSVAEDVLSASSPETLANRGLAAPRYDDGASETTDGSYTPPENTTASDPTTAVQPAPAALIPQDRQSLQPDNIRVGSVDSQTSDEAV